MTSFRLALEFDVNQVTRSLQYRFITQHGTPEEQVGPLAGTYHFEKGDEMSVSVTATAKKSDNVTFEVSDCTLVSIGTADLGKFFLSPFSETNAITNVPDWPVPEPITTPADADAGRVRLFTASKTILPVTSPEGQWKISGYLSVNITIDGKVYNRLFFFDPEGTSGSGGWSWPNGN